MEILVFELVRTLGYDKIIFEKRRKFKQIYQIDYIFIPGIPEGVPFFVRKIAL